MTRRLSNAAGAAAMAVALVALLPGGAAGQETSFRTPDGHPDLQGVWNFSTATPMERPEDLAGQTTLTAEEAAAWEQRLAEQRAANESEREDAPAGSAPRLLGPCLVRARPYALRAADLAGHRSAGRTHSRGAAGGGGAGGAAQPPAREARPRPRRPRRLGALPPRVQLRAADDPERLQQQRAALPDRRPRGHPQRDGAQRAHRSPGRPPAPAGPSAAMGRRLAGELGRRHARDRGRGTFSARPPCGARAPTCTWSSASRAPAPTR